jgi:hypothetical protein
LGRSIDPSGARAWGALLAQTQSRYAVAKAIITTFEAFSVEVNADFRAWLGRNVDPTGQNLFVSNLLNGAREEMLIDTIFASVEYSNKLIPVYDTSLDKKWINQVFQDLLGRSADTSAFSFFTTLIRQGTPRQEIVPAIASSDEFHSAFVTAQFNRALSRPPRPDEISPFVSVLRQGGTLEQVQAIIYGSSEFFFGPGNGNNLDFLKALYNHVLGQPLDNQGLTTWGTALANGVSRSDVAESVLTSPAGIAARVSQYYLQYLRRGTDSGASGSFAALQSGTRDEVILGAILGSPEYYKKFTQ